MDPSSLSPSLTLLLVYDSPTLVQTLRRKAHAQGDVEIKAERASDLSATLVVERAVMVECCTALAPYLSKLAAACDEAGVVLIGLHFGTSVDADGIDAQTQSMFERTCHAHVDVADQSALRQIVQHVRWHTRVVNPEDPLRRRALVPHRPIDRRVKHLRPYAEFFRTAPEAMVVVDDAGTILYTNPAARSLAGVASSAGPGNVFDYLQSVEVERAHGLAELLATRTSVAPTDFCINTSSGARVISVHASKMQRSPGAFLLTFRDVTDQRQLQQTLTHTKDFLQQVIDSSVDAIVSADLQGNILVFNRAAGRIFDYDPTEVVGKLNVRKLYPPGGAESIMRLIRSHERNAGGQVEGHQTQMLDRQGNIVPVRLSAAFVREGRSIVATVGVFTDIRHELALAEKLRKTEAELHETEKGVALAELAGMTAHELNQPLTIILGYSELLQRVCTQPEAQKAAEVLASQAQRLAEIVRRIGRITRYETKGYVGGAAILDLDRATHESNKA